MAGSAWFVACSSALGWECSSLSRLGADGGHDELERSLGSGDRHCVRRPSAAVTRRPGHGAAALGHRAAADDSLAAVAARRRGLRGRIARRLGALVPHRAARRRGAGAPRRSLLALGATWSGLARRPLLARGT